MKKSLLVTAAIVVLFSALGWQSQSKLSSARTQREQLIAEAQTLGIDTSNLSGKDKLPKLAKTQRQAPGHPDREAQAKEFAMTLIAFGREMDEMQKAGKQPDEATTKHIFEILGEMLKLDAAQMKILVIEVRSSADMDDGAKRNLLGFSMMVLANDHPTSALALFVESAELDKGKLSIPSQPVDMALSKLANSDPVAAVEWIRKNAKDHPSMVTEYTKQAVLTGAAKLDPKMAFSLIADLEMKNVSRASASIGDAAKTPEERTAVMEALRDYLAKSGDAKNKADLLQGTMRAMATSSVSAGYDHSQKWLETAKLTHDETIAFANEIDGSWTKDDSGKWMDWMSDKLPATELTSKVSNLMENWTRSDYKAAGTWLIGTKEGPAKNTAVFSYAATVAPYEPDVAAGWAATLPDGDEKKKLMGTVYSEWKKKDEAAAAKFAKENGISP